MARRPVAAGERLRGRRLRELVDLVLAVKGTRCHLCGQDGADTADHVIPRAAGGDHTVDNCEPAHRACNLARGALPLDQWYARHPLPHRTPLTPSRQW